MENLKHHGSQAFKLILALVLAAILLLWGWNSAVPDIFALPNIQFKQAVGLVTLIGVISLLIGAGNRRRGEGIIRSYHNTITEVKDES
jgi:hypothetical protein